MKLATEHIQEFASYLRREEKSAATQEKYLRDVRAFCAYADGNEVTKELVVGWKKKLIEGGYAVRSINSMLASANSLLDFLGVSNCKVKSIRTQRQTYCPEDKELTKAEYLRLLAASKKNEQLNLVAGASVVCGLKADGTVLLAGDKHHKCDVHGWEKIAQIAVGSWANVGDEYIVGLKTDGTVVATGNNKERQCDVENWTGVIQVVADSEYTLALRTDGKVLSTGTKLNNWDNIVSICASAGVVYGLRNDGSVAVAKVVDWATNEPDVQGWQNIVQISAGHNHVAALQTDGTVVAAGNNDSNKCDVKAWKDIVDICAGSHETYGLKSDGTIVNTHGYGDELQWKDIVQICTGGFGIVGLTADGKVYGEAGKWHQSH